MLAVGYSFGRLPLAVAVRTAGVRRGLCSCHLYRLWLAHYNVANFHQLNQHQEAPCDYSY